MLDWLKTNGGHYDGIEVPVKFSGGEVGIAASRDLPAKSAIMCIPGKTIMSVRKSL
jgi:hypothetical protein